MSLKFTESKEFMEKLSKQINLSDYDSNGDGNIDALYVWDMSDGNHANADAWKATQYNEVNSKLGGYIALFLTEFERKYEEYCLYVLIHETGHLLLGATDYYLLGDGTIADTRVYDKADIGNVHLGESYCDYDGWSKYYGGWLTPDNVLTTTFGGDEEGMISLTPYDSDSDEGNKIAFLYDSLNYEKKSFILVDYCGGLNNNRLDNDLRKKGFRFYKGIGYSLIPPKILDIAYSYNEDGGVYQLFSDGDEAEIEFPETGNKLKIYDIQTGNNPSFKYSFDDISDIGANSKMVHYSIKIVDENGFQFESEDFSDPIEFVIENHPNSDDFYSSSNAEVIKADFNHSDINYNSDAIKEFVTNVKLTKVPEGYKTPSDIPLNFNNGMLTAGEIDGCNIVIDDSLEPIYKITIMLEQEHISEDEKENNTVTDDTGELNNNKDESANTEESSTTDEQAKPTEATKAQEDSTKEESDTIKSTSSKPTTKQPETATPKSSGTVSKVSRVTPKPNTTQTQGIVAATNKAAPQTGDNSNTPLWITIAGASAGVLMTAVIAKRKKRI